MKCIGYGGDLRRRPGGSASSTAAGRGAGPRTPHHPPSPPRSFPRRDMAGTGRGAPAELWGVLLPPRRAAEGSEDEEDEEVEEEPHLVEAALLEASGRDLAAALPPRRAGEGKREGERERRAARHGALGDGTAGPAPAWRRRGACAGSRAAWAGLSGDC